MNILPTALTFNDVLLVPSLSEVKSRKDVDMHCHFSRNIKLQIPIVSANMDTVTESEMAISMAQSGGLGVIHRFLTVTEQVKEVQKVKQQNCLVGAAIGINGSYLERCHSLVQSGVDVLVLDVAHGHSKYVREALQVIKQRWPKVDVVAGNVATLEGTRYLVESGADGVKVGIGPGATCSTRVVTGCGVPQLSAIIECSQVDVPVTADGGIRNSGDITKALAAGASCVMVGNLLAGTKETPGFLTTRGGIKYKTYRGMASTEATISRNEKEGVFLASTQVEEVVPEGVETSVPYKGTAKEVLTQLVGGLASGMSYCGASNLRELREKATFVQITQASWQESLPVGY